MEDAQRLKQMDRLALDYRSAAVGNSLILHADCFEWLRRIPEGSLHAIVTDPLNIASRRSTCFVASCSFMNPRKSTKSCIAARMCSVVRP
jgi:hypothetical protein